MLTGFGADRYFSVSRWQRGFDELMLTIGAQFGRVEPWRRVRGFVEGLLAGLVA